MCKRSDARPSVRLPMNVLCDIKPFQLQHETKKYDVRCGCNLIPPSVKDVRKKERCGAVVKDIKPKLEQEAMFLSGRCISVTPHLVN